MHTLAGVPYIGHYVGAVGFYPFRGETGPGKQTMTPIGRRPFLQMASAIDFGGIKNYKRWTTRSGSVVWHRATFERLPTTYPIINGLADLDIVSYMDAEMTQYSMPGIGVWANSMRAVEPA